jgi:uncharacterized protein (DUF58 family)
MHLTGRALLLALAATVAFVAEQWSADPDIVGLWRMPLLLLVFGLGLEAWLQSRTALRARLVLPATLHLGRAAEAALTLQHGSSRSRRLQLLPLAPPGVRLADPSQVELRIPPGEADAAAALRLELHPDRLGRYAWPALPARLLGTLGLAWWDRDIDPGVIARVLPDLLRRGTTRTVAPAAGPRRPPQPDAEREVHRWRRWEPGDPLTRIDWKVTARAGVLTTRELRDDQHLDVLLCIDAGCDSAVDDGALDVLGERVNLAARLAESALARGDRVGLLAFSDRVLASLPPSGGPAALSRLRARMATLAPDPLPSGPEHAARAAARLLRHPGLVVWFGDPLCDDPDAKSPPPALRALAARHAVVVVAARESQVQALADPSSDDPRRGWTALAAERRLAAARARAETLRRNGLHVVSATPARLESAVWSAASRRAPASRRAR